jgi:endo-1,4-beta-xylanase
MSHPLLPSPQGGGEFSRRSVIASTFAVAACSRAVSQTPPDLPPLKSVAPFAVGTCVQSAQLADPAFADLVADQVSQVTAEWEMKMEYILRPDGSLRFDGPDAIAAFARGRGLRLLGHTIVWYAQTPDAFARLEGAPFRAAFEAYVSAVVGRYRSLAAGWDVVNEAVAEDGDGWRASLWSQRLGDFEHMRLAFELARAADPEAVLFLNDYNLESLPKKRATFLSLAEALMKAGAPIGGVGTQTHVGADMAPGAISDTLKALAGLGLKVRISEMDVSLVRARGLMTSEADLAARQARVFGEAASAFAGLPARQQADFTFWGLKDSQSWLRRENPGDAPLLFDDAGRPKPAAAAWERAARQPFPRHGGGNVATA